MLNNILSQEIYKQIAKCVMRIIVESCEKKKIDNDNLDDVFMWQGFSGILKRNRECEDRVQTRVVYRKRRRVVRAWTEGI